MTYKELFGDFDPSSYLDEMVTTPVQQVEYTSSCSGWCTAFNLDSIDEELPLDDRVAYWMKPAVLELAAQLNKGKAVTWPIQDTLPDDVKVFAQGAVPVVVRIMSNDAGLHTVYLAINAQSDQ